MPTEEVPANESLPVIAVATRRQVSSIVLSIGSPATSPIAGPLSRYFMSQICCEIEPTRAMAETSSYPPEFYHSSGFVRRTMHQTWSRLHYQRMTPRSLYDEDFYAWTQQQA